MQIPRQSLLFAPSHFLLSMRSVRAAYHEREQQREARSGICLAARAATKRLQQPGRRRGAAQQSAGHQRREFQASGCCSSASYCRPKQQVRTAASHQAHPQCYPGGALQRGGLAGAWQCALQAGRLGCCQGGLQQVGTRCPGISRGPVLLNQASVPIRLLCYPNFLSMH